MTYNNKWIIYDPNGVPFNSYDEDVTIEPVIVSYEKDTNKDSNKFKYKLVGEGTDVPFGELKSAIEKCKDLAKSTGRVVKVFEDDKVVFTACGPDWYFG